MVRTVYPGDIITENITFVVGFIGQRLGILLNNWNADPTQGVRFLLVTNHTDSTSSYRLAPECHSRRIAECIECMTAAEVWLIQNADPLYEGEPPVVIPRGWKFRTTP
jgi:hypothetical protein